MQIRTKAKHCTTRNEAQLQSLTHKVAKKPTPTMQHSLDQVLKKIELLQVLKNSKECKLCRSQKFRMWTEESIGGETIISCLAGLSVSPSKLPRYESRDLQQSTAI